MSNLTDLRDTLLGSDPARWHFDPVRSRATLGPLLLVKGDEFELWFSGERLFSVPLGHVATGMLWDAIEDAHPAKEVTRLDALAGQALLELRDALT